MWSESFTRLANSEEVKQLPPPDLSTLNQIQKAQLESLQDAGICGIPRYLSDSAEDDVTG